MKPVRIAGIAAVMAMILGATAFASDIFSVRTALDMAPARKSCDVSMPKGGELRLSADDLEIRLGLEPSSLRGVTFTSLPGPGQGRLELDGFPVEAFESVGREELDGLSFVPEDGVVAASLTFIPRAKDAVTTELMIHVTDQWKAPPELRDVPVSTARNVTVTGYAGESGPDWEGMSINVVKSPNKGVVRSDGLQFTYTPYLDASGKDRFTIRAADNMGNVTNEATISIHIEKLKDALYYSDMAGNPSTYAAVKLREKGVISGWQIGGKSFFYPGKATTRGEFIVAIMAAAGFGDSIRPTVNTGLKNDMSIPLYLKPYVKQAVDEGIWPKEQSFVPDEVPLRAEAVALTCRAAELSGGQDFALRATDAGEIPGWALPSYESLAANGMLVLHDNTARPLDALTNAYAADLLWQIWARRD